VILTVVPWPDQTVPWGGKNVVEPEMLVAVQRTAVEDEPVALTTTWQTQVLAVGFGRVQCGPSPGAPMKVGDTRNFVEPAATGSEVVAAMPRTATTMTGIFKLRTAMRTRLPSRTLAPAG